MDNNENKNLEIELEEVKTEEAVETAEKAVDNADEAEEAKIEFHILDLKIRKFK